MSLPWGSTIATSDNQQVSQSPFMPWNGNGKTQKFMEDQGCRKSIKMTVVKKGWSVDHTKDLGPIWGLLNSSWVTWGRFLMLKKLHAPPQVKSMMMFPSWTVRQMLRTILFGCFWACTFRETWSSHPHLGNYWFIFHKNRVTNVLDLKTVMTLKKKVPNWL